MRWDVNGTLSFPLYVCPHTPAFERQSEQERYSLSSDLGPSIPQKSSLFFLRPLSFFPFPFRSIALPLPSAASDQKKKESQKLSVVAQVLGDHVNLLMYLS